MSASTFKRPTTWTGNTFPAREAIKAIGGVWDAEAKAWEVPALGMSARSTAGSIVHKHKITVK